MLQLQPNTPNYQTVSLTINERLKNWAEKSSSLGILFVITDQLTQKEYKVISNNGLIVATDRYYNISLNTDGTYSSDTKGGVLIKNGGYYKQQDNS